MTGERDTTGIPAVQLDPKLAGLLALVRQFEASFSELQTHPDVRIQFQAIMQRAQIAWLKSFVQVLQACANGFQEKEYQKKQTTLNTFVAQISDSVVEEFVSKLMFWFTGLQQKNQAAEAAYLELRKKYHRQLWAVFQFVDPPEADEMLLEQPIDEQEFSEAIAKEASKNAELLSEAQKDIKSYLEKHPEIKNALRVMGKMLLVQDLEQPMDQAFINHFVDAMRDHIKGVRTNVTALLTRKEEIQTELNGGQLSPAQMESKLRELKAVGKEIQVQLKNGIMLANARLSQITDAKEEREKKGVVVGFHPEEELERNRLKAYIKTNEATLAQEITFQHQEDEKIKTKRDPEFKLAQKVGKGWRKVSELLKNADTANEEDREKLMIEAKKLADNISSLKVNYQKRLNAAKAEKKSVESSMSTPTTNKSLSEEKQNPSSQKIQTLEAGLAGCIVLEKKLSERLQKYGVDQQLIDSIVGPLPEPVALSREFPRHHSAPSSQKKEEPNLTESTSHKRIHR